MYDSWKTRIWLYIKGKENGDMLIDLIENGSFQFKKEITIPGINGALDEKRAQTLEDLSPKEKTRLSCDIKATNIILLALPVDIYTLINHYQTAKKYGIGYAKLINDMNIIHMTISKIQVNTKFVNHLQPEWSRYPGQLALVSNTYNLPPSYNSQRSQYVPPIDYHSNQPYQSYQPNTPLPQQQIIHSPLQQSYEPHVVPQHSHVPSTQLDSRFILPSFLLIDDPITSLDKAIMFKDDSLMVMRLRLERVKLQEKGLLTLLERVVMYEDQQDFLLIDWKKWKTVMIFSYKQHKIFKANHVDAYDLDCDDEATTSAIFMASLSPAGSHNGDTVSLTYNSDILYEVPHYDTYHENDELNSVVQET
ncbi:hypothetical protein Tco_1031729 [Tanacetum coccineum]|uniref:Uncharacterized protein n=1 Tax=Tanacetum coccineum TaxID=301880 RepID=A0ABQ5GBH1_9ASTR